MKKTFNLIILAVILATTATYAQKNSKGSRTIDPDGFIAQKNIMTELSGIVGNNNLFEQKSLSLLWEDDENVSNHEVVDSWDPRIAVESNGTAHIVFGDNQGSLQKIMYSKKEIGGDWTTPIIVDDNTTFGDRNNHVPAIAVSANGDVHVAFLTWASENWRHEMAYTHYDAASQTWSQAIIVSGAGGSIESFEHIEIYSTADNQPVIVWGFDNRTGTEEVYMNYFDGADWSGDILVSTPDDSKPARFPRIENIDENSAMIIFWEETGESEILEIQYRILDENNYSLSPVLPVPQTLHNTENFNFPTFNFELSNKNDGHIILALWEYEYPNSGQMSDTIKCIDYNIAEDSFEMSPFKLIGNSAGYFPKYITVACDNDGNIGIVFLDTYSEKISFTEFDPASGFSTPEVIVSEDLISGDLPDSGFDDEGNLHITWDDLRFDAPGGYVEREVFYKKGVKTTSYSITFIVTEIDGISPIANATIYVDGDPGETDINGEVVFDGYFEGTYTWVALKTGYEGETGDVSVIDEDVIVEISLDAITAILDYELAQLSIYPNPTEGIITINNNDIQNIKVLDITGKEIEGNLVSQNQTTATLNISDLESGFYFIQIFTYKGLVSRKVFKK
ncbi:MAG: hypothetical protein DRJ05_09025 [Bacteroidetes bacterium]|nr:MAG: hypothetical protein DRJ05_09025 [Bacteroidota bacterium]